MLRDAVMTKEPASFWSGAEHVGKGLAVAGEEARAGAEVKEWG